jgi:phage shock protein E
MRVHRRIGVAMDAIHQEELKRVLDEDLDTLLIDVRDRDSYLAAHIAGAINVPAEDAHFVERVRRQATGDEQRIVVYGGGIDSPASTEAAEDLARAGFRQVRSYQGGLGEWQELRRPVVAGAAAL